MYKSPIDGVSLMRIRNGHIPRKYRNSIYYVSDLYLQKTFLAIKLYM